METICIQVSPELAERLRPYQSDLPDILDRALRQIELGKQTEPTSGGMALQQQVSAVLHQAGARGSNPEEIRQYLTSRENQQWVPIRANGKPASELIVEERKSRPWTGT
jgi:hypothetical protein